MCSNLPFHVKNHDEKQLEGAGQARGFIWLTLSGHNPLLQELKKDLKQKL